jgi:hypothetical protein
MIVCHVRGMPRWVVCAFFVLQASLMNSTSSLTKAVILQNVPESDLNKWTVAETLQMVLWSMGAATGGYIVDGWGILVNFTVTAILQLFASLPLTYLYCVNPEVDEWKQSVLATSGYGEQASTSIDPFDSCCDGESGDVFQDCVSSEEWPRHPSFHTFSLSATTSSDEVASSPNGTSQASPFSPT